MALDKLVDSSKLDAALNYEANRILAKTGGNQAISFDFENEKGFGDIIDTIIKPSGTKEISISSNGTTTEDINSYASARINVAVPNTYTAGDEGKVVSSGTLIAQGSASYTSNGTYDTTLVSLVEVSTPVPSGTISISSNGEYDVSDYAVASVEVSGGGDTFDEDADFCFWDYDGTPLYSFSKAEIQAMTALPSGPDHSQDDIPLTFLYWNWSLADLKALTGTMDIGACYKPTDGKMHWFYKLTATSGLTCSFTTSYTNDVVINWGDGTEEHWGSQTDNGANPTHTYAEPGLYHCTWYGEGRPSNRMRTEGNDCVVGQFIIGDNMTECWLGSWWGGTSNPTLNGSSIETIITNGLMPNKNRVCTPIPTNCRNLKFYVMNPYDQGNHYYGRNCTALKGICFANSWTATTADYTCSNARNLKRVRIAPSNGFGRFSLSTAPLEFYDGVKLGYKDLESVPTLKRLVIKSTIDSSIFGTTADNLPRLEEIWCGLTTPPTLGSATPFSKIASWAKIHVPASAVEDYKAASNWAAHESKIVGDWTADPIK